MPTRDRLGTERCCFSFGQHLHLWLLGDVAMLGLHSWVPALLGNWARRSRVGGRPGLSRPCCVHLAHATHRRTTHCLNALGWQLLR